MKAKKIKRIAIFADHISGYGGTEFYVINLALLLKKEGFDIRIYSGTKPNNFFWVDLLKKHKVPVYFSIKRKDRMDLKPENKLLPIIIKHFKTWQPDIIHACPLGRLLKIWQQKGKGNIPLVGTEITTPSPDTSHWYDNDLKENINQLKAIITWCKKSNSGVRDFFGYKGYTCVIPHFIPLPKKSSSIVGINYKIGCIARLSPEKGLDYLIGAMVKVIKVKPKAKLYIYGHGSDLDRLNYLIKSLGLTNRVIMAGVYRPIFGVDSIALRHNIFVQPSLFESIPTVALEMIARKRIMILTDVGGVSEIFKNNKNAVVVERANTCALAKAIISTLDNLQFQKKISLNAHSSFISNYNNSLSLERHLDLYHKVI